MAKDKKKKKPEEKPQELLVPKSPREITPENAHLVDFENLKVRLICLISDHNAFASITNFLIRRGWEVLVTTELKEALSQAGTYNPDFVLVSVNHPHKKIKQFPQIVMQTFNVPTIVFGEKTDSKTLSSIQTSRATHKIMGHLSGPTAQRKIKSILQELYQPREESKTGNRAFSRHSSNESIRFKSEAKREERIPLRFAGKQSPRKGRVIFEKNQANMRRADGYNPFSGGGKQGLGSVDQGGAAYDPTKAQDYNEGVAKKKPLTVAEKLQKDKEDMAAALRELGSEIGSGDLDKGEDSTSSHSETQEGPKNKEGYTMESEYVRKKDEGYIMESGPVKSKSSGRAKTCEIEKQSFIEKATIEIVNTMRAEEHENPPGLGVVSRVALLSLGHDKHKGYFMIAGHDIGMNLDDFVQEFTEHFKKLSMARGEHMEFGDYINMDCPGYDFFDNGEEGLEFNYVASFAAGEVGIKFIHDEEAWAHAEKPENHEKALIKTEQVVEDKPLEIDLFVHLKRNEKYYKIVGEGSDLSAERKERLLEKETKVYINEGDVGTYRSFQTKQKAQKAINGTVQRTTKKKAS